MEGANTILFIKKEDIPTPLWQDFIYGRVVVSYRPEKKYPNRTRFAVGEDRVKYPGYCGTPTVSLLAVTLLINSVVFTLGSRYMTFYIKAFYLNTPIK